MDPVVHFEMPGKDKTRMTGFYKKVFDWEMNFLGEDMGNYVVVMTGKSNKKGPLKKGMINGGFYDWTDDLWRQNPSIVISVKDINKSIEKVKKAGGEIHGKIEKIPGVGLFISFMDTEGNKLSMLQAEEGM